MGTPINGRTFNKRKVSSGSDRVKDFAIFGKKNYILHGCGISYSGLNITVASGSFVAHGAKADLDGAVTLAVTALESGTVYGYVVATIDLTKTNTASDCQQCQMEILTAGGAYPTLTQEDIDGLSGTPTKYQLPLAKFTQSVSGIETFEDCRPPEIYSLSATLAQGNTSLTISDSRIRVGDRLTFYTSIYGVNPLTVSVSAGQIVLTFPAQSASMEVEVECK